MNTVNKQKPCFSQTDILRRRGLLFVIFNFKRENKTMQTLSKIQAVLLALILMASIPISANATDGQINITQPVLPATFPIIINKAGSYVLTSNLVVTDPGTNAITIEVNDVTLDLNGHKIQGPNTGTGNGYGIYASDRYSCTVNNGRIWGFGRNGVFLSSDTVGDPTEEGAEHIVENIQAMNNTWGGIRVSAGLIIHCTANNNGFGGLSSPGIVAINSPVSNCTANKNTGNGVTASQSTVVQCTTNYNRLSGIESYTSIIRNCTAYNNSRPWYL